LLYDSFYKNMLCPQLKQNLETIKNLKLELDLELARAEGLFKVFKNNNPSTSLRVFDNKAKAEFKKDQTELINKIKYLKAEIDSNIKTIEELLSTKIISAISPEGKEIKFELKEQLKYWGNFYKDEKVDWITLPENIKITEEQRKEIERLISEFGFDKMIIIPENLAATGVNYKKLHTLMSKDYNETRQSDNFKADGSFAGLKNKSNKLRIILTRDIKELDDDELFKQTLDKKMDELDATNGILTKNKLKGLDVATYLIYQKEYFKRTGKHLDVNSSTWFPEQIRATSGYIPRGYWDSGLLVFNALAFNHSSSVLGCRLVGSLEV
jgi:hypothetical protein